MMLMDLNEGLSLTWASSKGDFDLAKVFQDYARSMLGVRIPKGQLPDPAANPNESVQAKN